MITKKTITLGNDAFDRNEEVFLPTNIDREREPLLRRGRDEGGKGFPRSQAVQPSAAEQEIIGKAVRTAEQTRAGLNRHFSGFYTLLSPSVTTWDSEALKGTIRAIPEEMKGNVGSALREFEATSAIKRREWRDSRASYDEFRRRNGLELRPPDYSSSRIIALLFICILTVESALNATLLWEHEGLLQVFGQTLLITAVNVLFGAGLAGLSFRYKNHVSSAKRLLVSFCPVVLAAILTFNFGVAHYRDALIEDKARDQEQTAVNWEEDETDDKTIDQQLQEITDFTKEAMDSFLASPLDIDSIKSAFLVIVGMGFFGFAAYKWYSMLDPYPGYRKRDLDWKKKHQNYVNDLQEIKADVDRKIRDYQGRIFHEKTKITDMRQRHNDLASRAHALRANYSRWIRALEHDQNVLLNLYRDSNLLARSDAAPSYFGERVAIDENFVEAPDFSPPDLQNVEAVIQTVNEAEVKSREIAEEVWQRFDRFADMQHESD